MSSVYGIYNAEGSLWGEMRYLLGSLTGRTRCELCELTHRGPFERSASRQLRDALGAEWLHRDELPPALRPVSRWETPCVLGLGPEGWEVILSRSELADCEGSLESLRHRLEAWRAAQSASG